MPTTAHALFDAEQVSGLTLQNGTQCRESGESHRFRSIVLEHRQIHWCHPDLISETGESQATLLEELIEMTYDLWHVTQLNQPFLIFLHSSGSTQHHTHHAENNQQ